MTEYKKGRVLKREGRVSEMERGTGSVRKGGESDCDGRGERERRRERFCEIEKEGMSVMEGWRVGEGGKASVWKEC